MRSARCVANNLGQASDAERRKRLGQYFTGVGLGRLLAALAEADDAKSIVDPMAGSGDLLASCLEIDAKPDVLAAIEIDRTARDICAERLPEAYCLLGSAFDHETIAKLPTLMWDLVIANPPYVRYQGFSEKTAASRALPSATQIRAGLLRTLDLMPALDSEDKRLFAHLVSNYSGLSDLAVPSWILCAAMVKPGGRLAMVVPESWLSRDYATIVQYLLFRWFDVEFVVEDEHASWFEDVQVKTTLLVAKRIKRRESTLSLPDNAIYCHISISAAAASQDSPIGRVGFKGKTIEKSFAKQARLWLRETPSPSIGLVSARPVLLKQAYRNVFASASQQKWFAALGASKTREGGVYIPHDIHDWLVRHGLSATFDTFESKGVSVGQGLRTGANAFFYANGQRQGDMVELSFVGALSGVKALVPICIVRPALRRQSELPEGFVVSPAMTTGWALDLRAHALPEGIGIGDLISTSYMPMPEEMTKVVKAAERTNFGTLERPQKIWELTAVAPNIRRAARGALPRYWYMLPDFAPRHLPDVLLPRVNSATPKAYFNAGRECLVDANFSTLWTTEKSTWTAYALVAFMNCAWTQAVIERSGAVMGGGALKVEATHLRRLPVPKFGVQSLITLSALGKQLIEGANVQATLSQIDEHIAQTLGYDQAGTAELKEIARTGQARRAKHNKKRRENDGDEVC